MKFEEYWHYKQVNEWKLPTWHLWLWTFDQVWNKHIEMDACMESNPSRSLGW